MTATSGVRPLADKLLVGLETFLGINGLMGGMLFLLASDGRLLQMPFSHLKNTPFPDFTVPGLLLMLFLGICPLATAYSMWKLRGRRWPEVINPFRQYHWSWAGSLAVGAIAIVWIVMQIQWIPAGALHIFIFALGVVVVGITLLGSVREYCRR